MTSQAHFLEQIRSDLISALTYLHITSLHTSKLKKKYIILLQVDHCIS